LASTRSWWRNANTRAAAARATMITKHDNAIDGRRMNSSHVTCGSVSDGKPPGTGPMVAIPWPAKSYAAESAIVAITAANEIGRRGNQRRPRYLQAARPRARL
jgi:hypothetical protein